MHAKHLVDRFGRYAGCPRNFIQIFNGSDSALETICKTFIEPGDEVIISLPTYDHFRVYAESNDAQLVPVKGACPFLPKMADLTAKVTGKTKIVYIVNPITNKAYSKEEIKTMLQKAPKTLVIVDEAYFEFCNFTMTDLLSQYKNLIVSRSFSKAFGLAGLRCGYVLTQPGNLIPINKVRLGKINSLTQVAACAALDDLDYMERSVFEVKSAKKWLEHKLKNLGLSVVDTMANYLYVSVANPERAVGLLEENDIFVRHNLPHMEGFLRITIGHPLLMERFWKVFEKIPSSHLFASEGFQQTKKL